MDQQFHCNASEEPKQGSWTYLVADSVQFFGTRGLVKARGTIDDHPFTAGLWRSGTVVTSCLSRRPSARPSARKPATPLRSACSSASETDAVRRAHGRLSDECAAGPNSRGVCARGADLGRSLVRQLSR